MANAKFTINLCLLLAAVIVLSACGTPEHRSIPERATGFTKHVLVQDACPYGTIDGSEKMGTSSDSSYEYSLSSRNGREEQLRFKQTGFKDVKCAPKPKEVKASTAQPASSQKPGAKK